MLLFRTGPVVMTRGIATMPSAIRYSIWSSADAWRGTVPGTVETSTRGHGSRTTRPSRRRGMAGTSTPCSVSTTPMESRSTSSRRLNVGEHDTVPGRVLKPWSGAIPTYKSSVDRNRLNPSGIWTCHDLCILSLRDSGHAAVQLLPILWTDDHNCSGSDQRNETVLICETGMRIRHPRFGSVS